jgi:hypothetical protein
MPGDRIVLQQMQWKIGTKGKPAYYEIVQIGHHEERLLLQENIMRNKQERTKEFYSRLELASGIVVRQ